MAIYELVVAKDNMLHQINELVDFTFILEELKSKYCLDNGRKEGPPLRIFKYLLLKSIFDLSDADVESSKYDMSFKYFLVMAPEEPIINPSSLMKFRNLRLQDVGSLVMLIYKPVDITLACLAGQLLRLQQAHVVLRLVGPTQNLNMPD